jgi:hypothetical protein
LRIKIISDSMKKILIFVLFSVFLLAGCTDSAGGGGKNALKYEITTQESEVKRGGITHFDFTVENVIEQTVENVRCFLNDTSGFKVESVKCNSEDSYEAVCHFGDMYPGEMASMDVTLRAPLAEERSAKLDFLCEYDFEGQSSVNFRIYDSDVEGESEGMERSNSVGPIQITPELNILGQSSGDNWVKENKEFTLDVKVSDYGDSGQSSIKRSDFRKFAISLENVHVNQLLKECDFTYRGNTLTLPSSMNEIKFNEEITCELTTDSVPRSEVWKLGQIIIDYDYRYRFEIKSGTIKVL